MRRWIKTETSQWLMFFYILTVCCFLVCVYWWQPRTINFFWENDCVVCVWPNITLCGMLGPVIHWCCNFKNWIFELLMLLIWYFLFYIQFFIAMSEKISIKNCRTCSKYEEPISVSADYWKINSFNPDVVFSLIIPYRSLGEKGLMWEIHNFQIQVLINVFTTRWRWLLLQPMCYCLTHTTWGQLMPLLLCLCSISSEFPSTSCLQSYHSLYR